MLLPVLSSARSRAQGIECLNNLRQIANATQFYIQDNDDRLPFSWYNDPDPKHNSFYSLLTPVLYNADFDGYSDFELRIYTCPKRLREPMVGPNPMRVSYGMNAHNSIQFPGPRTHRSAVVTSPANTVLLGDLAYTYNHPPLETVETYHAGYKHKAKCTMIFFDTHASALSLKQTNDVVVKFH